MSIVFDPEKHMVVDFKTEGPRKGRTYTIGLNRFKLRGQPAPELEILDVPLPLAMGAVALLNTAAHLLMHKSNGHKTNHTFHIEGYNFVFQFQEVTQEMMGDYSGEYGETKFYRIVEAPEMVGACDHVSHQNQPH